MSRNKLTSGELISKCCGKTSYKIGSNWLQWGRHLGLSDSDLDNIGSDNAKNYEKADNVLKKWKEKNGNTSWEQLKKELIAFERYDIVVEIEKEFGDELFSQEKKRYEAMDFDLFEQARKEIKIDSSNIPKIASKIHVKKDISEICAALKNYYLVNNRKINEVQTLLKTPANVDLVHTFVDLCIVDAVNTQLDFVFSVERREFLKKQMSYTPIPYSELFIKEKSVMLISGIAGIGKTWLLRKCLLDWSNSLIWKNVELVFYLECRRLNQYQNVSNINELLNIFYSDVINDFDINNHSVMFMIDGLDEFKYLNELVNPTLKCEYKIVSVLADIKKCKHVVAGRVYAIDQYQSKYTEHSDKSTIQIMGFNENGINNYIENHVKEEKKEVVKTTLKESPIAKAMASVPFYLSSMCKIIGDSNKIYTNSFLTMTELYANIFLYFLQKHVIKNDKLIYVIMEDSFNKNNILNVCKIAYQLFIENKIIFSKEEIQNFINDFDQNDSNLFGFIEKVETNLGCYYQFAHLTIMEFCVSVYAYNCLSRKEIMANKKLRSCLSMICGLTNNKSRNNLIKFLVNLNRSNESLLWFSNIGNLFSGYRMVGCTGLVWILDRLNESNDYEDDLFIECFYESQSSFTNEIKSIVDKRWWIISIDDRKTSYLTSCENYFVNHYVKSGRKLSSLSVYKSNLSDQEKKLLIQCSTNVSNIFFYRPINLEGWKPKDKIEELNILISRYLITKKNFEENFLPWFNLCEELYLDLHDDIDFIKEIYEWIRCSNVKKFWFKYREKYFDNLDELKYFTT
ncbi:NACHT, LRR and PYD domains-containing protein 14 [Hydra vulgaris]|uniref:NACHT, LRR and PYD domains-containing protein 14 n=1 Tax=Hydra vulgaris TaxID=6087 RepID=UPI001F5E925E|nr:NACHT, LRR and PYD domains-containing protein 14 isoform X2 [Hydra vulgaris]